MQLILVMQWGADDFLELSDTVISLPPCNGTSLRAVSYTKTFTKGFKLYKSEGNRRLVEPQLYKLGLLKLKLVRRSGKA